ncbi:MAG: glycoside hydrolase family 65 protein [Chloroflexota bacterium]
MIHRERLTWPEHIYPIEEWRLVEKRFNPGFLGQTETFFALANGYLGMRGVCDEGSPVHQNGTFVNGFYESWPISYPEDAFGLARTGQTMVSVTDAKMIRLYVDDEPLYLPTATLLLFERALNMKDGTLDREIIWETPSGKQLSIRSRRLVSFQHRHLAAISYELTLLNGEAPVVISSEMSTETDNDRHAAEQGSDPRKTRAFQERIFVPGAQHGNQARIVLSHMTRRSKMRLTCGVDHVMETECPFTYEAKHSDYSGKVVFSIDAKRGLPVRLTKFMTYHTSRRAPLEELSERAERTLDRAAAGGFGELLEVQKEYVADFWQRSDIVIEGDARLQQAIRFNLYHILQAAARAEGAGIPAKGLTGHGYEGHYFWDTEIYVLPFLIYTSPRMARNLLKFRHSMLDSARQRAREVNQRGALFPWRTINGEEASAYYAAGTAQYHINADIMYALKKYVEVTGDESLLHHEGAEMLVETARLWRDLGFFSKHKGGLFCIAGVTGPDEYNTVVNNNTFTNLMARKNLWFAASTVRNLRERSPDLFADLFHRTGVTSDEVEEWLHAAEMMYLPYDEKSGIHLQDDGFLEKRPWDFINTPKENYPLLLHYHPLVIYRSQVIKQADIILAMFLLGDEFTAEQKKRNFDFYDPLTTGDSSLSVSIQAVAAFELQYREKATDYMRHAVLMDLADVAGNAADGCHIASMGGTWMTAVYGYAGMRDYDGHLSFCPLQPLRPIRVRIPLTVRGQRLELEITQESVTYSLREGEGVTLHHCGEKIEIFPGKPISKPFVGERQGDLKEKTASPARKPGKSKLK